MFAKYQSLDGTKKSDRTNSRYFNYRECPDIYHSVLTQTVIISNKLAQAKNRYLARQMLKRVTPFWSIKIMPVSDRR